MQVKIFQGCLNQCKNHAPLIESHGLTEVGSATGLPKDCTDFLKCSRILTINTSYLPIRVASKKKMSSPRESKQGSET